jgi:hypothetical protein
MAYLKQYDNMLRLAQQHRLFSASDDSLNVAAFSKEYRDALDWAVNEYQPPRPLPSSGLWHDFIYFKAESSVWKYCCKIFLPRPCFNKLTIAQTDLAAPPISGHSQECSRPILGDLQLHQLAWLLQFQQLALLLQFQQLAWPFQLQAELSTQFTRISSKSPSASLSPLHRATPVPWGRQFPLSLRNPTQQSPRQCPTATESNQLSNPATPFLDLAASMTPDGLLTISQPAKPHANSPLEADGFSLNVGD